MPRPDGRIRAWLSDFFFFARMAMITIAAIPNAAPTPSVTSAAIARFRLADTSLSTSVMQNVPPLTSSQPSLAARVRDNDAAPRPMPGAEQDAGCHRQTDRRSVEDPVLGRHRRVVVGQPVVRWIIIRQILGRIVGRGIVLGVDPWASSARR